MSGDQLDLTINLDLEASVFLALCADLAQRGFTGDPAFTLDGLAKMPAVLRSKPIRLVVLFARSEYPDPDRLAQANAMIHRAERALESYQLTQNIIEVNLVDCGMHPTAPLSHYFNLSSFLESYAESLPTQASGSIHALTYDEDISPETTTLHDTQSEAFMTLMMRHTRDTLQTLNENFGQGSLPDVPSGD